MVAGAVPRFAGALSRARCAAAPRRSPPRCRAGVAPPTLETARERAGEVLGRPLIEDLVDRDSGALAPLVVVTDNGPCYKARDFARYIHSRPEFEHVRTRHRSPESNGVIERWYQSLKYEHLYLHEIDDGPALAERVLDYARIYNHERPHETIEWQLPYETYIAVPAVEDQAA